MCINTRGERLDSPQLCACREQSAQCLLGAQLDSAAGAQTPGRSLVDRTGTTGTAGPGAGEPHTAWWEKPFPHITIQLFGVFLFFVFLEAVWQPV